MRFCTTFLVGCLAFSFACNRDDSLVKGDEPKNPPAAKDDRPLTEGGELLVKAQKAYRALKSYSGTIELVDEAQFPGNVHRQKRSYKVDYQSPDRLRFDGKDSNGDPLFVIVNGRAFDSTHKDLVKNGREALQAHVGVSLHGSTCLPAFLLGIDWTEDEIRFPAGGHTLTQFAKVAKVRGDVVVDGHACREVECVYDVGTWVFAVDKKSHLIRQLTKSTTVPQQDVRRAQGGGGFSGRIQATKTVQTFHVDSIDQPVDQALFKTD